MRWHMNQKNNIIFILGNKLIFIIGDKIMGGFIITTSSGVGSGRCC